MILLFCFFFSVFAFGGFSFFRFATIVGRNISGRHSFFGGLGGFGFTGLEANIYSPILTHRLIIPRTALLKNTAVTF